MPSITEELLDSFLKALQEKDEFGETMVEELRSKIKHPIKVKAADVVTIFTSDPETKQL